MTFDLMAHRRPDGTFPDMRTRAGERVTDLKDYADGTAYPICGFLDGVNPTFTLSGLEWIGTEGYRDLIGLWEPDAATAPTMSDMQAMTDPIAADPAALEAYMAANPLPDEWTRRDEMAWELFKIICASETSDGFTISATVNAFSAFETVDDFMAVREASK